MGKVIAVANQKGGVGKTTTVVNLSAALGAEGAKVMAVDVDPQGNATSGFGIDKRKIGQSVYEALIGQAGLDSIVRRSVAKNVDMIPSHINLAGAEVEIVDMGDREARLKNLLRPAVAAYDYILIDCPPSLGLLTLNALCAADSALIPAQCEYYALEGMSQLMNTIRQVKKLYNPGIYIEGVLLSMYDGRLNLTLQVVQEIKKYFPNRVYKTVVPRNVKLSEAPSYGKPINIYDKYSKGSEAYAALAREIMEQNGGTAKNAEKGASE